MWARGRPLRVRWAARSESPTRSQTLSCFPTPPLAPPPAQHCCSFSSPPLSHISVEFAVAEGGLLLPLSPARREAAGRTPCNEAVRTLLLFQMVWGRREGRSPDDVLYGTPDGRRAGSQLHGRQWRLRQLKGNPRPPLILAATPLQAAGTMGVAASLIRVLTEYCINLTELRSRDACDANSTTRFRGCEGSRLI